MKWIFLSPHLDDIAFSCGGYVSDLANDGQEIEIWSICAGDPADEDLSPFALALHRSWGLGLDAVRIRREEDQKACRIIGATPRYFSYLDSIYRKTAGGEFLYTSDHDIFGGLDPREADLIDELSGQLENEIEDGARVVAPLGIGNHVDHELTRKAVNRLEIPLTFYADYPYAREDQGKEILAFMERSEEWQYRQIPISDHGLEHWILASRAFESQISTFWADEENLALQINEFSSSMGGIKLWEAIETH